MRYIIKSDKASTVVNGKKNVHPAISQLLHEGGSYVLHGEIIPKKNRQENEYSTKNVLRSTIHSTFEDGSFMISTEFYVAPVNQKPYHDELEEEIARLGI